MMKKALSIACLAIAGCHAPVVEEETVRFEVSESVDGVRSGRLINSTEALVCVRYVGNKPEVRREWWDGNEWKSRAGDCGFGIGPGWVQPGEIVEFEFHSGGGEVRHSIRLLNHETQDPEQKWIVVYGEASGT